MVEGSLETEKVEFTGVNGIQNGIHKPVLHREPSFSRWCSEDGVINQYHSSDDGDASVEESDFELPLLQLDGLEKRPFDSQRYQDKNFKQRSMDRVHTMDADSVHVDRGGDGRNYVPFDVEDGPSCKLHNSSGRVDDGGLGGNRQTSVHNQDSISLPDVLKTLFFIVVWYGFSLCLTLYNKTLLGDHLGKFPAPLLMNTVHFTMQAVLSNAITWFYSKTFQPTVRISWNDYFTRVVPTALGTALDVNLSNASLVFISVTFATMCKSASPIFLLLFAFAFRLESPSIKLLGIMLVISAGILLTVAKETEFEFWGFIFVMLAAVMSGFRWCMTQILLQTESHGLENPLTLMSYLTPVMAVTTALFSLILDPWDEFKKSTYFNNSWHVLRSCLLMLFGGTLAFFMVLTEYVLVSVTSAVTVTIAGVVKEAVTILVAVFYFHDQFTWLKGLGLLIIIFGVSLFNWYKYQKLQRNQVTKDVGGSLSSNVDARYAIIGEMDDDGDHV